MKQIKDDDYNFSFKQIEKVNAHEEIKKNAAMFDQLIMSSKTNKQYMYQPK